MPAVNAGTAQSTAKTRKRHVRLSTDLDTIAYRDADACERLSAEDLLVLETVAARISLASELSKSLEALREQPSLHSTLLEHTSECVALVTQTRVVYLNPAALRELGIATLEALTDTALEARFLLSMRVEPSQTDAPLAETVAAPRQVNLEVDDGSTRPVEVTTTGIAFKGVSYTVLAWRDVSIQCSLERQLADGQALFTTLLEQLPMAVVLHDNERIVYANPYTAHAARVERAEDLIGRELREFIHPDSLLSTVERLEQLKQGHAVGASDVRFVALDGTVLDAEVRAVPINFGDTRLTLMTYIDITERRWNHRRVEYLAFHDLLTGLLNRNAFLEQQAWVSGQPEATLIYLDLCDFAAVNDRFGHADGDRVLIEIAQRFQRIHERVARLESDAFALLIEGTPDVAERLARQLLETLETPVEIHQANVTVRARVGLVSTTVCGANILELLRGGVMALAAASSDQPAPLRRFSRELSTTTTDELNLLRELKDVISADGFEIYLQPIIRLRSARVVKFEVLLRWFHPTRGAVSPTLFIEMAERFNVIAALDRHVIRKVLHLPSVFGCVISINVSPLSVLEPDFVEFIADALHSSQFPAESLWLELTERVAISDWSTINGQLERLRRLGIRIALDDFGIGYSTLSQLHHLSVDMIKLDRSFIDTIGHSERADQLLKSVIAMGERQNIKVLGEGIQTAAQAQFLVENGCEFGQGYFFAYPESCAATIEKYRFQLSEHAISSRIEAGFLLFDLIED